ncbi:MAG: hypothetical protein WA432_05230 [Candidatus Babeliaceae bacterium]
MALKLNPKAIEHAEKLIKAGECEHTMSWEEAKPTQNDTVRFLDTHNLNEYGYWFLAINTDNSQESKEYYELPIGDFNVVYKGALLEAHKVARHKGAQDIEGAVSKLIKILDEHKH